MESVEGCGCCGWSLKKYIGLNFFQCLAVESVEGVEAVDDLSENKQAKTIFNVWLWNLWRGVDAVDGLSENTYA